MISIGIFLGVIYYSYSVVNTHLRLSFKTQSSIIYNFTNSYFIAIVKVLFLIHYPLQMHFKGGFVFL